MERRTAFSSYRSGNSPVLDVGINLISLRELGFCCIIATTIFFIEPFNTFGCPRGGSNLAAGLGTETGTTGILENGIPALHSLSSSIDTPNSNDPRRLRPSSYSA